MSTFKGVPRDFNVSLSKLEEYKKLRQDDEEDEGEQVEIMADKDFEKLYDLQEEIDAAVGVSTASVKTKQQAEVGLDDFKTIVYGGLIFFVILTFPQFSYFGDCYYLTYHFTCYSPGSTSLSSDNALRYAYTEAQDVNGELTGLYVSFPGTCGSSAYYLNTTIPPDMWDKFGNETKLLQCLYPIRQSDGTLTYGNFTQDLLAYDGSASNPGVPLVENAGTAVCRIPQTASKLALAGVILLVVGFIFDQGFGVVSERTQKVEDRAMQAKPIGPDIGDDWYRTSNLYPAATVLTFATIYNLSTSIILFANGVLISFLIVWMTSQPLDGAGCSGPSLVAPLLIILAALSIFVEFLEWLYQSYQNYWPSFVRSVDGISGNEAILIDHVIKDHYSKALVALEDRYSANPVVLRGYLHERMEEQRQKWLNRSPGSETFRYFTFYRAICCIAPPCYFFWKWCGSRDSFPNCCSPKENWKEPKDMDEKLAHMEAFLKERLRLVTREFDKGYFPRKTYVPTYTHNNVGGTNAGASDMITTSTTTTATTAKKSM